MIIYKRILRKFTPPIMISLWKQIKLLQASRTPFERLKPYSAVWSIKKLIVLQKFLSQIANGSQFEDLNLLNNPDYFFVDERIVEYTWCFAWLYKRKNLERLLDVGCTLNQEFTAQFLINLFKELWFINIEYEPLWSRGRSSIIVNDIRKCILPSNYFDVVTCISTLEHVGMANWLYTSDLEYSKEDEEPDLWKRTEPALLHMKRVLKPNGMLLITVPFGKPENRKWFQVYGKEGIDRTVRYLGVDRCFVEYFRVVKNKGWIRCNAEDCANLVYGENVPAAQAIACLRFIKGD